MLMFLSHHTFHKLNHIWHITKQQTYWTDQNL